MTARYATRDAILIYLRTDDTPKPRRRITAYLRGAMGVSPQATRAQLKRLVAAGVVEVEQGGYRVIKGDVDDCTL